MRLHSRFDCVVMLTWSDWHTEPRSNRYHYATRLARELPVFFVQPDGDFTIRTEKVQDAGIEVVHASRIFGAEQACQLISFLRARRCRRPLLWVYNSRFIDFVRFWDAPLRVYHATENYLLQDDSLSIVAPEPDTIRRAVRIMVRECDLVVSVADAITASHAQIIAPDRIVTLRNGCDAQFWLDTGANQYRDPGYPAALYQGGINGRLDFEMIDAVAAMLPNWQFWFCGSERDAPEAWHPIKGRSNVRYFGVLDTECMAKLAQQARVGLIPFVQKSSMRKSLPLKRSSMPRADFRLSLRPSMSWASGRACSRSPRMPHHLRSKSPLAPTLACARLPSLSVWQRRNCAPMIIASLTSDRTC